MTTSAHDFLEQRKPWLKVDVIERGHDAWDIAIVIDGTYFGEHATTREAMVRHYQKQLSELLDDHP